MDKNIINYINKLRTLEMIENDDTRFLTVKSYKCVLNNGEEIKREKILKGGSDGSAAIILPITGDNKIILAIEPRVFTKNTVDIGLPAGYIEEGEDAIDAAKRELLEETGFSTDKLIELGSFYQDQGCSAAYNHYFIALDCIKVSEQKLDESEFIKYAQVDFDELDQLLANGYITGLNSAYLIEKSKSFLKDYNKTSCDVKKYIR